VGHLLGRLQRYVADVKADINREIELEELRKMRDSMQKAASEMQSAVDTELTKTADELNRLRPHTCHRAGAEGAKAPSKSRHERPGSSSRISSSCASG